MIDKDLAKELTEVRQTGDELALAAAQVVVHYDGIHRLRAALAKWYNLRAGIYATPEERQRKKSL